MEESELNLEFALVKDEAGRDVLAAVHDGRPIGWLIVEEGEITETTVAEEFQGRGVAVALMAAYLALDDGFFDHLDALSETDGGENEG